MTVDDEDITVERGSFVVDFWIPKAAIWVEPLGGKTERDVVLPAGQIESGLCLIVENVETSLSEVGILCSVVYGMIVIPKCACVLGIGIVIIFVLAWLGDIIGPTRRKVSMIVSGVEQ